MYVLCGGAAPAETEELVMVAYKSSRALPIDVPGGFVNLPVYVDGTGTTCGREGSTVRRQRYVYAYAVSLARFDLPWGTTTIPCGWCERPMAVSGADVDHADCTAWLPGRPQTRENLRDLGNVHLVHVHCNRGRKRELTPDEHPKVRAVIAAVQAAAVGIQNPRNAMAQE